jgi:hypothetical protein
MSKDFVTPFGHAESHKKTHRRRAGSGEEIRCLPSVLTLSGTVLARFDALVELTSGHVALVASRLAANPRRRQGPGQRMEPYATIE